jgi:cytochrome P450
MQRDETLWDNPNEFDPDRFSAPRKGSTEAWQPFSTGPRRCIGQQLSIIEAKVICVLTLRWFDFESAINPEGPSIPGWGGRAYQELKVTAKPKDGIPMTVKLRSQ